MKLCKEIKSDILRVLVLTLIALCIAKCEVLYNFVDVVLGIMWG